MTNEIFTEISIILAAGTAIAFVMHLLRQPLIIGHIITGILIGPAVLDILHSDETVEVFAKIGITLLLFIIGLGLNPRVIKEVGKVSVLTGLGQIIFTTAIGFGLIKLLGYNHLEGLYIAVALAFSSTIIILKLLTDKKEQGRLYGKISIGFLLVQDVIATIALVMASTLGDSSIASSISLPVLITNGILLFGVLYLASTKILPAMSGTIAGSQEFLFIFALGWGLGIASLFALSGFSLEVGALFAGVALASTVYAQEVGARLRPIRDFFIVLFFISLGASLGLESISTVLPHALILSLFVLIGNPIIVMFIMGMLGYTKKTSFKAGLTVAQISEFSLVFVLLGRDLGNISEAVVSLVTVVALITIAISTYMILYADKLYDFMESYLRLFERRKVKHSEREHDRKVDIVLFGYKKGGEEFIKVFETMTKNFLVVDYDPHVIDHLEHSSLPYVYGDALDIELLEEAGVMGAKLLVSTVSDQVTNVFLVSQLSKMNPKATLIFQADNPKDAAELYEEGATYVMMPRLLGSEKISSFIKRNGYKKKEFDAWREKHLKSLQKHMTTTKQTDELVS